MASWSTQDDVPYAYECQKRKERHQCPLNMVTLNLVFPFHLFLVKFPFRGVFRNTILVIPSLMFALILLFTSEINITLYPAHIPDPTCIFFISGFVFG